MSQKEIFTRQTIIPTDKNRDTSIPSRDEAVIKQIQQKRYQEEQIQHYTRQAEPIKEKVKTDIQNKIKQKEELIKKEQERIEKYEKFKSNEKEAKWRKDYENRIDEARDDIAAYQRALDILKSELDKYEKIRDPLEIVNFGTSYGDEVIRYSEEVQSRQMSEDRSKREIAEQFRRFKETEEFKRLEKEYNLPPNISRYEFNKFIQEKNTTGQYNIKTGKFYPTKNPSWVPPNNDAKDVIYITKRMADWNKIEKKLDDGSILIQLQNPANKDEIVNVGTRQQQQESVTKPPQTPDKTLTFSLNPAPIPLKTQLTLAPTIKDKAKVLYGFLDDAAGGFLPGGATPEEVRGRKGEYQKRAEEYSELVNKSFYEVMSMANFKLKEFVTWSGKKYRTDVAIQALAEITRRDLENDYKENVLTKVAELTEKYNNQVSQVFNTSLTDVDLDKKINKIYNDYEKQIEQLDKNWQEKQGKRLLEERTEKIEMFKTTSNWKLLSLPKIGAAAATGALVGGLIAPASAGAFGLKGVFLAKTIQTLGVGALALGVGATLNNLVNEYSNGTLTKERLMSIVGPQIILVGATTLGGAVGGSIGIAKFKKAQTEFMLNMNKQIVGNEALQKKIFTPANMKRGYAEFNYGRYKMRFNVNEKMLAKLQIQNIFVKEGGLKYKEGIKRTEYIGLDYEKRLLIEEKLRTQLGLNKDSFILNSGGIKAIKVSAISPRLKIVGAEKLWYSVSGTIKDKSIEILFTLSKDGKIMNPYIAVKTPSTNPNVVFVNMGKIIRTPRVAKMNVKGGTEVNTISVNVKPIGTKLVLLKKIGGSVLDDGNIILEKAKYEVLIKELFGAKTGKIGEENLFDFMTRNRIIQARIKNKGMVERGEVDVFSVSKIKDRGLAKEISTSSKIKGKLEQDIFGFNDIKAKLLKPERGAPSKKMSQEQQFINVDKILPEDIIKTGKSFSSTKLNSKVEAFNPDYILGTAIPTPKIKPIKLTPTKTDNFWQVPSYVSPSYVSGTKGIDILGKKQGLDYNMGVINRDIQKSKLLTKSINKTQQKDIFGLESLNKNLNLVSSWSNLDNKTAQKQISLQSSKQKTDLKQKSLTKQQDIFGFSSFVTNPKIPIPKPTKPEPKPLNWGLPTFSLQPKTQKSKDKGSIWDWGFVAKVRRRGKFKPVSKVVSKEEAFFIGSDIVKNTLGATFKVEKTPKKIKVKKKYPSWEWKDEDFYTKKDRGETLFIQKREKRLGTRGEKKEIQRERKSKSKNKSFLDWW